MSKRRTRRERGKNKTAQLLALTASLRRELVGTQRAVDRFRKEARVAREAAREEALREFAGRMADEVEFTKHMLRAASEEIGRALGDEVGKELRRYDDVFAHQRKIATSLLHLAASNVNFDAFTGAYDIGVTTIRIDLPAIQQNFVIR